ncbi:MAG TPA: TIR domain-containing protein [Acidimicrobiia bacterium]|nr:TIR domain-containing protein [Acidimicrobiia bacterium]
MDTGERTPSDQISTVYDGFISYSHAADDLLAPRLQAALQRFAKPWWKRRALRVFRDESSLSANPHLWSSITEALDGSSWFVLLLSPDAAASPWVKQEIEYWVEHKDPSRILPVVSDGEFGWDGDITGGAAPEALRGVFPEEPRWVDLRFAREEEQLDLKNPRFSAAVADIASALRGVPKDELESEEVRQHRRTIRTAWAAAALVGVLAVAATIFAIQSAENAREAEAQRITAEIEADRADANAAAEAQARVEAEENATLASQNEQLARSRGLAASAIAVLDDDPELSTLLALHAIDQTPEGRETPLEAVNALWRAGSSNPLVDVYDSEAFTAIALSADGSRLVASVGPQELRMLDAATGEVLWSYTEETVDVFDFVEISADGRVALAILDSRSPNVPYETDATDDLPNRIVVLDADDGNLIQTLDYEECLSVTVPEWSPDGRFLAVSSGVSRLGSDTSECDRGDGPHWVEIVDTGNWEVTALLRSETTDGPSARWDEAGALHLFTPGEPIQSFEPLTFEERPASGASGHGDVSPEGDLYLTGSSNSATGGSFTSVYLVDSETGASTDILYNEGDFPFGPEAVRFSPDGGVAIVGTRGRHTYIYDLPSNELIHKVAAGPILSVAYDPLTGRLYTSGDDPGIKVWDLEGSSVSIDRTIDLREFTWVNGNSFRTGPSSVAIDTFAPIDTTVWKVWLFDPATGELVAESPDNMAIPQPLPDDRWVTSGNSPNLPMIWIPDTGETVQLITCEVTVEDDAGNKGCGGDNEPWGYMLVVTPDGDRILVYGDDDPTTGVEYTGHFRAFDAATGSLLDSAEPGEDPGPADPFALRPTDDMLNPQGLIQGDGWVFGRTTSGTLAYDLATGDILYEGPDGSPQASPKLDLMAVNNVREVTILDISSDRRWNEIASITTDDRVRGLAFNADGSKLAVGDASTLYVVDTTTWLVAQQVKMPSVSDIHWLDDETVVIGTATGIFGTVSLSTDRLVAQTRAGLLRSFTDQECAKYRIDPCPTPEEMRRG